MAAQVQSTPNGSVPSFKIVERLDSVPVVHDSVAYAQSLINSTQLTTNLYNAAVGIAARSAEIASPVLSRAEPLLKSADGVAVAVVDRAEAAFPYPFVTPTQDLIGVKQAKAVYDSRFAPIVQQAQPIIQEYINKTAAINNELGARVAGVVQTSTEVSHQLLEQLHALAEQGKELPHQLIEGLGKITNDVKEIVVAKEVTVQEKTHKLGEYVVAQVKPIVDEIYKHVVGAKQAANDKVESASQVVNKAAEQVKEKVDAAQSS